MLINSANVDALNIGVTKQFEETLKNVSDVAELFTDTITVSGEAVLFPFDHPINGMNEWKDKKQIGNLKLESVVLRIKDWERTISIPRNAMKDDQLGFYSKTGEKLGRPARLHRQDRAVAALKRGKVDLGFDNKAVFATNHDLNPAGNQSNLRTSLPLNSGSFETAFNAMVSFTGADGKNLNILPDTIIVPPQLAFTAKGLFENVNDAAGATNKYRDAVKVVVVPELSDEPANWYLADQRSTKAVHYCENTAPNIVSLTDPSDPNVFHAKEYLYSAEARGEAILAPWFLVTRCEG